MATPLRIAWPRLRLWALGLFGIGLAPIVGAPFFGFHDWPAFWTAGHLVGTPDIVSADATIAWQRAHGISLAIFPYPAPAALLFWPFAQLPIDVSFWLNAVAMLACGVGAGILAAAVYGLPAPVAVLGALAWAPLTGAVVTGQNTPLALLLAMLATAALVRGRSLRPGLAAAALLYKPTIGAPLAGLFLLRGRWAALAAVAAGIAAWYGVGIWATGGLVDWPAAWLDTLGRWLADDAIRNADKAVSVPGLVSRLGLPDAVGYAVGGLLVIAALPRLLRAPLAEAAAGALLVGVAVSPHAWSYEAALLLPIVWWAMAGGIQEPWRTRVVVAAYVLGPFWLVSRQTAVSAVAFVVIGAYTVWVTGRWREAPSAGRAPAIA